MQALRSKARTGRSQLGNSFVGAGPHIHILVSCTTTKTAAPLAAVFGEWAGGLAQAKNPTRRPDSRGCPVQALPVRLRSGQALGGLFDVHSSQTQSQPPQPAFGLSGPPCRLLSLFFSFLPLGHHMPQNAGGWPTFAVCAKVGLDAFFSKNLGTTSQQVKIPRG